MIKDSGERREFSTGAVRDITEDKGRCDLLPLDVIAYTIEGDYKNICINIEDFKRTGDVSRLYCVLADFSNLAFDDHHLRLEQDIANMALELAKHYEEGAKKYSERNWEKGIPLHCYMDSATRHLLKYIRGDDDERHDRAFAWNIVGAIWTCKFKPELNEYPIGGNANNEF